MLPYSVSSTCCHAGFLNLLVEANQLINLILEFTRARN